MPNSKLDYQEMARKLISLAGGYDNIESLTSCMTRLRITVRDRTIVKIEEIKAVEGVLGLVTAEDSVQIIIGPGKVNHVRDCCKEDMKQWGQKKSIISKEENMEDDWKQTKAEVKGKQSHGKLKSMIRNIAEIFMPLIPAIIAAGLFAGLGNLILALQDTGRFPTEGVWQTIQLLFKLLGSGFLAYFSIFTGINAAKQFGATEVLGGMIGGISISANIVDFSTSLGLYNKEVPLNSVLNIGKGGVIGVIIGVWILAKVEKWMRKRISESLSLVFVPFLSLLIVGTLFVIAIMPVAGMLSDGVMKFFDLFLNSNVPFVQALSGYVLAALFLPLVLLGLHQGLFPLYAIQLESMGGISLFPALAMAGAGQVGASLAILILAKKVGNEKLIHTIRGALPAGILGVGEPLIYGVTLPLFKPFITAGLGAGFGGAYVMVNHVLSVAWEPSGILGVIVMQPSSMLHFVIGIFIAAIGGFAVTLGVMRKKDVIQEKI